MSVLETANLSNPDAYRLALLYGAPPVVKSASIADFQRDETPDFAHADPAFRRFPVDTAASTWVSCAQFEEKRSEFAPRRAESISAAIDQAALRHGIATEIAELRTKVAEGLSAVERPDDYAYDFNGQRRLPLRNPDEICKAATWLQTYRDHFTFDEQSAVASRIRSKAGEHGVDLGESAEPLRKLAGDGVVALGTMAALLRSRAATVSLKHAELADKLRETAVKVASACASRRSSETAKAVARLIDSVDREAGLIQAYGNGLVRPADVLFAIEKSALARVAADCVDTVTGSIYKRADLARLRVDELREHLGDDLADALTHNGILADEAKIATIVPTLPRPDARALDALAAEHGILPVLKMASVSAPRLSIATLKDMAADFIPPTDKEFI